MTAEERSEWMDEFDRRACAREKTLIKALSPPSGFKRWWPLMVAVGVTLSGLFGVATYLFVPRGEVEAEHVRLEKEHSADMVRVIGIATENATVNRLQQQQLEGVETRIKELGDEIRDRSRRRGRPDDD